MFVLMLWIMTIELLVSADENEPVEGVDEEGTEASLLLGGVYTVLDCHNSYSVGFEWKRWVDTVTHWDRGQDWVLRGQSTWTHRTLKVLSFLALPLWLNASGRHARSTTPLQRCHG
jgi:hypothetical protein